MSRTTTSNDGFTPEERAAMKEHAAELRAAKRRAGKKELELQACLDKIAELPDADRAIAERIHALVLANAPGLTAKTWYGMPAYARDGNVICFFQPASKFGARLRHLRVQRRRTPRRRQRLGDQLRRLHAHGGGRGVPRRADRPRLNRGDGSFGSGLNRRDGFL